MAMNCFKKKPFLVPKSLYLGHWLIQPLIAEGAVLFIDLLIYFLDAYTGFLKLKAVYKKV